LIVPNRSTRRQGTRPTVAFRQRSHGESPYSEGFGAPEVWHEPTDSHQITFVVEPPGRGFIHPVSAAQVRERVAHLPQGLLKNLQVVQFSRMTRKRLLFPCYGMQWGTAVYLYPIEETLVETYAHAPRPEQLIEARMYGGRWEQHETEWQLRWTEETVRDFYLNNVLIHEIGHTLDDRNGSFVDRERYANWFAVEHGYRASRGRRRK
jgi:hypothetical protein